MIGTEDPVSIGPVHLHRVTLDGAVQALLKLSEQTGTRPIKVMASNAQFLQIATEQPRFAAIARDADLNVADGMSLVYASRLLGQPLPERIAGIDLMLGMCEEGARSGKSVFLLGGHPGAAAKAAKVLKSQFQGLVIAGVCRPPFGSEFNPRVVADIRSQIQQAKPHFLFVCFGAPKQEYWIEQHASDLPVKIVMGNGAAFDVVAGYFKRPPRWIQNAGCEWLYRVSKEPRRLWKRYLVGNAVFAGVVAATWLEQRTQAALKRKTFPASTTSKPSQGA